TGEDAEAPHGARLRIGHTLQRFGIAEIDARTDLGRVALLLRHPRLLAVQEDEALELAWAADVHRKRQFLRLLGTSEQQAEGAVSPVLKHQDDGAAKEGILERRP